MIKEILACWDAGMLGCWNTGIIKEILAPVKSAPLAFGISRGKNAGIKIEEMLECLTPDLISN